MSAVRLLTLAAAIVFGATGCAINDPSPEHERRVTATAPVESPARADRSNEPLRPR